MAEQRMKKNLQRTLFYLVSLLGMVSLLHSEQASVHDIQTAYIYNFAKFIKWSQKKQQKNLKICVLGESALGEHLQKLSRKTVKQKEIRVQHISQVAEAKTCHMLIVPELSGTKLAEVVKLAQKYHIVTISDHPDVSQEGVVINFFIDRKKVRFAINNQIAKASGIKISSKLLRVAKVVSYDK